MFLLYFIMGDERHYRTSFQPYSTSNQWPWSKCCGDGLPLNEHNAQILSKTLNLIGMNVGITTVDEAIIYDVLTL